MLVAENIRDALEDYLKQQKKNRKQILRFICKGYQSDF